MEKVNVTYKLRFDPENLPEDFDEQILTAFKEYTEGTSHDFTHCDQLLFIDNVIGRLSKATDEGTRVEEILEDRILYEWRENHELIEMDELYSDGQMEEMYRAGKEDARLYKDYGYLHTGREEKAIQKMVLRIIRIVSSFKWEE